MACRCKRGRTGTRTRACMSQSQHVVASARGVCPTPAVSSWPGVGGGGGVVGVGDEHLLLHPNSPPNLPPMRQVLSLFILQMRKSGLTSFRKLPEVPKNRTVCKARWELGILPDLPSVHLLHDRCVGPCSPSSGLPMSSPWCWAWGWEKGLDTVALLTDTSFSFFSSPL